MNHHYGVNEMSRSNRESNSGVDPFSWTPTEIKVMIALWLENNIQKSTRGTSSTSFEKDELRSSSLKSMSPLREPFAIG